MIAKIKLTSGKLSFNNRAAVEFKDGKRIEMLHFSSIKMYGMMSGNRMMTFDGFLELIDKKEKLKCVVFFDIAESTKMTKRKDEVEGIIYKYKEGIKYAKEPTCIRDLTDIDAEIARIDGMWTGRINIGGLCYWNVDDCKWSPVLFANNALPSEEQV